MSEPEQRRAKSDAERQAAHRERKRQKEGRSKRVKLSDEERRRRNVQSNRKSRERAKIAALESSAVDEEAALKAAVEELCRLALQLSKSEVEKISTGVSQIISKRTAKANQASATLASSAEESAELHAELDRAETSPPTRSARSLAASHREEQKRNAKRAARNQERRLKERKLKEKGLETLAMVNRVRKGRPAREETVEELLEGLDLSDPPDGETY